MDLENLREANGKFAKDVEDLKEECILLGQYVHVLQDENERLESANEGLRWVSRVLADQANSLDLQNSQYKQQIQEYIQDITSDVNNSDLDMANEELQLCQENSDKI